MQYRNLGNTGLKVSVVSYGNWVNCKPDFQKDLNEMIKYCWD
jgi:voltage-dependent potassium channel beta subunit